MATIIVHSAVKLPSEVVKTEATANITSQQRLIHYEKIQFHLKDLIRASDLRFLNLTSKKLNPL